MPEFLRIAVLLPCFNEEAAIGRTVAGFRTALPRADIYVYDNNSADRTSDVARSAGAVVRTERRQGKGAVVRRMFADVDADVYVLADGDATYDSSAAPSLIGLLLDEKLDMVIGTRVTNVNAQAAYRPGHALGNKLLTALLSRMFGQSFSDILTGYRVFSRRFVKSFPALSAGFEIETEISVHALELAMPCAEAATEYFDRPVGSFSKLNTYADGLRILGTMLTLYRSERPVRFFGVISCALCLISIILAFPLAETYLDTGLVPRFPTAILITGLMIISVLSISCGLILDTVTKGRLEFKRLVYLSYPAPGDDTHGLSLTVLGSAD